MRTENRRAARRTGPTPTRAPALAAQPTPAGSAPAHRSAPRCGWGGGAACGALRGPRTHESPRMLTHRAHTHHMHHAHSCTLVHTSAQACPCSRVRAGKPDPEQRRAPDCATHPRSTHPRTALAARGAEAVPGSLYETAS